MEASPIWVNFLATYRINAGTVFFFGYDDRYQQFDRFEQMGDELLLRRDLQRTNRAIFTKLQYLFRLEASIFGTAVEIGDTITT